MISGYLLALAQLDDPKMRGIVWMSLALAVAVFVLVWLVAGWALTEVPWGDLPLIGWIVGWTGDWFGWIAAFAFGGTMLLATFVLFPAVMTGLAGVFLDRVVDVVEARHYPGNTQARRIGLGEALASSLKFILVMIVVNIIALPVYGILLFTAIGPLILYYLINGYLVGREFYEVVAFRRLPPGIARNLRKAHRGRVWLFGALTAFLMTVPFINLITPVLAAAAMVHLFERLPRRPEYEAMSTG